MKRAVVVAAILVTAAVRPAAAEEEDKRDEDAYWSVALVGGLLVPTGDLNVAHQTGLIAGGRMGWISRLGLGVEVDAAYSPLPRKPSDTETARGHFGVATVGPRYTLAMVEHHEITKVSPVRGCTATPDPMAPKPSAGAAHAFADRPDDQPWESAR